MRRFHARVPTRVQDLLFIIPAAILISVNVVLFFWVARYTFAIHRLTRGVGDTVFLDARGRPWFRMDEQRIDVPLTQISTSLQQAVIAVEDHRFYRHFGVDLFGVGRALFENVRSHDVVQGGSTLTQQLARTIFLSNQRTYARKLKEALLSLMMEEQLSKDQILELYLNRIYLSGGVYGVESMSRRLFGKHASEITLPQAAMIAGLIRAPSTLSPWSNPEGALRRSRVVLEQMRKYGLTTPDQETAALREPPVFQPTPRATLAKFGYAKEFLRREFRDSFGGEHPPDWRVETGFLPEVQEMAERAIGRGLARYRNPALQAALVALDPKTGNIVALVGGRSFADSQFNRATRSRRQPGSAFKPFVFAAALERGYSPVSVISGLNAVTAEGAQEWSPRNIHDEDRDQLTLREALLESNNKAAVELQQKIQTRLVIRLAYDAGLEGMPDVPSLALGTGEVTPLDLTAAFAVFANGGVGVTPRGIIRVLDADGSAALENGIQQRRVISAQTAYQMVSMLEDVMQRGTAASSRALGVTFESAGKTGTTNDYKDAWFVGFTSSLVAGVWVGYDQPQTIAPNATGARVALPIWADFMRQAGRIFPPSRFPRPNGLREQQLCNVSYLLPMQECPVYTEYFKEGDKIPERLCPIHGGTLRQRATRVAQGIFGGLADRIRGWLGGKKDEPTVRR